MPAIAVAVLAIECIAALTGGPRPTIALTRNPFAAIAAASIFCRYLVQDRRGPARRWIVYAAPLAWLGAVAREGWGGSPLFIWLDALAALGIVGVSGFVAAAALEPDRLRRTALVGGLQNALLLPLGASMVSFGLWSTSALNPVYDMRVFTFEEQLGLRFSQLGVRSYDALAPLSAAATACYVLLALGVTFTAALQGDERRERAILLATLAAGAVGFALYFVCPVAGPMTAFGPFYPLALPPADGSLIHAPVGPPRNGMPSLHTIWALLIWFNAGPLRLGARRFLQFFVLLTLWAVMGLRDTHWFMDVIVAVPLAVAIQTACVLDENDATLTAVVGCASVSLAWLWGFRSGAVLALPSVAAWAAVAATVAWPLSRMRQRVSLAGVASGRAARRWGTDLFESSS